MLASLLLNIKRNISNNFDELYKFLSSNISNVDITYDEIILNTFTIQTMSKAKYSDTNIGHYGIASKR